MSNVASGSASAPIKAAAQAVVAAVNGAVIANHSGARESGTGISINLPTGNAGAASLADYTAADFNLVADTHWRNFLQAFTTPSSRSGATSGTATRSSAGGPAARTGTGIVDVLAEHKFAGRRFA